MFCLLAGCGWSYVGAEVLGIVPLRGVDAADGSSRFAGLSGFGWAVQLGVWSAL